MKTFQEYLGDIKKQIREVEPAQVQKGLSAASKPAVIDIREPDEWAKGIIPGAVRLPRGFLEIRIEKLFPDREQPLVVTCAAGVRSSLGTKALQDLGYRKVESMRGGMEAWYAAHYPVEMPMQLTDAQKERYSRHIMVPEVGEKGQEKLLKAKVLLIGAGGLGSPSALYLAAAGIGTMGIVDGDVVDVTNLQRQVIHKTKNVGKPKTESAAEAIRDLNPDVKLNLYRERITPENALKLVAEYDVVVDGCDNFGTRYMVNDVCMKLGKPNVYGSIFRFEGQVSTFLPGGPCYRCLFPERPPADLAPGCNEAGVLGVLPGVVGLMQATEAVKLVLGIGKSLAGRLLSFNALDMTFHEFKVPKDKQCPVCGEKPAAELPSFVDPTADIYGGAACAVPAPAKSAPSRAGAVG